ncbi:hypothetical protein RB653_008137 [Dictyostelium firmibasis]|uniref:Uncharacterized protein n=1 Tax=Dictyostelium firmibasis TaxID=79012 RepID=A0AAN7YTS5_9MYCE
MNGYSDWLSAAVENTSDFFVGMVVLASTRVKPYPDFFFKKVRS